MRMNEESYFDRLDSCTLYGEVGKVTKALGLLFEAELPGASVGSVCRIRAARSGDPGIEAEVIAFRDRRAILMPYEEARGLNNDSDVVLVSKSSSALLGPHLLGRVINARGQALDDRPLIPTDRIMASLYRSPVSPLGRTLIDTPLDLGIRALNGLLTVGCGQRVGIMAGSGVGKSVLLGSMARHTAADINVIALIGERGREVREFIERDLGEEGLKRSVVVVSTSDTSPLLRMRGAFLATTIAEYFRDLGKNVLLMMDSATRFAMAQREMGLAMGEPPASRGYTPSVFATLPKLLERAGMGGEGAGSVTGLYTVLVESDDMDDPIADAMRSILDGHIVLSRKIAQRNRFPAIDVLQSTSRVMRSVVTESHLQAAAKMREWLASYAQAEDLIRIGAYVKGTSPKIDQALIAYDRIEAFLRQGIEEKASFQETAQMMEVLCAQVESMSAGPVDTGKNQPTRSRLRV